jgi:hypothetical protein
VRVGDVAEYRVVVGQHLEVWRVDPRDAALACGRIQSPNDPADDRLRLSHVRHLEDDVRVRAHQAKCEQRIACN